MLHYLTFSSLTNTTCAAHSNNTRKRVLSYKKIDRYECVREKKLPRCRQICLRLTQSDFYHYVASRLHSEAVKKELDTVGRFTAISAKEGITKPCLCNSDPLKPHFYIVKLGFTGVYNTFLFLLKNIDCGYSLEPPRHLSGSQGI